MTERVYRPAEADCLALKSLFSDFIFQPFQQQAVGPNPFPISEQRRRVISLQKQTV